MKKLLTIALAAIMLASCTKEQSTQPQPLQNDLYNMRIEVNMDSVLGAYTLQYDTIYRFFPCIDSNPTNVTFTAHQNDTLWIAISDTLRKKGFDIKVFKDNLLINSSHFDYDSTQYFSSQETIIIK